MIRRLKWRRRCKLFGTTPKAIWHNAHETAQSDEGQNAAWVHAYLHRKEGDMSNAGYWYRRAGRPAQSGSLEDEWESIVKALLG
ncbi:MAG TPA: hypothetical protein VGL56_19635 [Fimbriimonadaceae bacterium]|jgi:hypothetical protein